MPLRNTLPLAAPVPVAGGVGPVEARRDTRIFLVGAVVPSPGCVVSLAQHGTLGIACFGTVSFVPRTAALGPGLPGDVTDPGRAPPRDAFQVIVTY